jgi:hypothetical protein
MKRNKTKDIIEGVLPATRNGAESARRDKAAAKRRGRRKVAQQVARIASCDDYYDADASDFEYFPDVEINEIKWRRREFDNLGALLRWARYHCDHQLAGRPDIEKYFWFKAILPDTMQGRHALGHIKDACLELEDTSRYFSGYYEQRRREFMTRKQREREDVQSAIVRILTEGYHKRWNQVIKRAQPDPFLVWLKNMKVDMVPKRFLEGWHDVEDFTDWIIKSSPRHSRIYLQYSTNNYIDVLNKFMESL